MVYEGNNKMIYKLAESTWSAEEKNAAIDVINSEKCTMGDIVKKFEKSFCDMIGCKYAVMTNSGSSSNLIMMACLKFIKSKYKLNDWDEVIVPAVSWATTYYPIYQNRLTMKFVDVNLDTLNIDEDIIEKAISSKTRAILAVNILGNPCDYSKLKNICEKYNLILLEDNCESLYAKYDDRFCGTHGLMGTYSTFFSHHICTVEGGITVTDDEEVYHNLLSLRAHGWTRDLPKINHVKNKSGQLIDDLFDFVIPGYNVRPNEIFAAIGIQQLKKLPMFIEYRKENYNKFMQYVNLLNQMTGNAIRVQKMTPKSIGSYFAFTMIFEGMLRGKKREIMNFLYNNGIECRPIVAGNFTKNPVLTNMDCEIFGDMKNAQIIDDDGVFIGNHARDMSDNLKLFFDVMVKYIDGVR
jgi:CDP-6-deoxy-D-xylo-4-hexulose-3-dehydrase